MSNGDITGPSGDACVKHQDSKRFQGGSEHLVRTADPCSQQRLYGFSSARAQIFTVDLYYYDAHVDDSSAFVSISSRLTSY